MSGGIAPSAYRNLLKSSAERFIKNSKERFTKTLKEQAVAMKLCTNDLGQRPFRKRTFCPPLVTFFLKSELFPKIFLHLVIMTSI